MVMIIGTLRAGEIITALDQQGDWILHSEGWTLIGTRTSLFMRNLSNVWEVTFSSGVNARSKPRYTYIHGLHHRKMITCTCNDAIVWSHSQ